MYLNISNISPESLHAQISRLIRAKILSGTLKEDDMLPSIRGLAGDLKVGVITVQRAYDDLIHENLVYSRSGKGYFVNALTDDQKKGFALDRFKKNIMPVIQDGKADGLTLKDIHNELRRILDEVK